VERGISGTQFGVSDDHDPHMPADGKTGMAELGLTTRGDRISLCMSTQLISSISRQTVSS
jgi:hypothetical protein